MSEANKGASGSPDQTGSVVESGDESKGTVSYDTYSRTLSEVKKLKAKLSEMSSKEQEREAAQLAEQGKWKEAAEAAQNKAKEIESKLSEKDKAFAKKVFNAELKAMAAKMGVIPEAMDDLPKLGDWSNVEIDEDFNINKQTLETSLANLIKSKPFLAKKAASATKDVFTSGSGSAQGTTKSLKEMTREELYALAKQMN
jgi:hypothetical protein